MHPDKTQRVKTKPPYIRVPQSRGANGYCEPLAGNRQKQPIFLSSDVKQQHCIDTSTISNAIFYHRIANGRAQEQRHSDHGTCFENTAVVELYQFCGIMKVCTPSHHPQGYE